MVGYIGLNLQHEFFFERIETGRWWATFHTARFPEHPDADKVLQKCEQGGETGVFELTNHLTSEYDDTRDWD